MCCPTSLLTLLHQPRVRAEYRKRAFMFGSLDPPKYFRNDMAAVKWTQSMYRCWVSKEQRQRPRWPKMINSDADANPAGGTNGREHTACEARAIGRRDRALRSITRQIARQNLQNEPN